MSELPAGWSRTRIRELGTWIGGGTPAKSVAAFWEGDIPWVSPKDMKVDRIRNTEDHISAEAVAQSSTNLVPAGSVLVVTRSGILRHSLPVAVTDREVALNQDLKALIPGEGIAPEYAAWALRASASTILYTCSKSGTTVSNLETTRMLDFEIPVAPTSEQRRIVAAIEEQFSRLDDAEGSLLRVERRLGALERVALELAFAAGRPVALGDLGEVITGSTPPTSQKSLWGFGLPFVTPGDLRPGRTIDSAERHVTDEGAARARPLPARAVLVTCIGATVGKTSLCLVACATNQQINALVVDESAAVPEFVVAALSSEPGQRLIIDNASSTTLPILNKSRFRLLEIPLPAVEQQRAIVERIETMQSFIAPLRDTSTTARRRSAVLRRAILERAFRGELVPQDPADEPASVLLERISNDRVTAAPKRRKTVTA